MTSPFFVFPTHLDGIFHRFQKEDAEGAIARGWIPAEHVQALSDLEHYNLVWLRWIDCECGRKMPLPPWEGE